MPAIDIDTPSIDVQLYDKSAMDDIDKRIKRVQQIRKDAVIQPNLFNRLIEILSMIAAAGAMISASFDVADTLKKRIKQLD